MVAELHSAIHRPFQESASTRPVGRACPAKRPRTNAAVPITRFGSRVALDEFDVDHPLAQDRYSNRALPGRGDCDPAG
jgi:hypothetical protein